MKLMKKEDMMKNKNSHEELLKTIISIRDEKYPEIPTHVIEQLILAEHDNTENFSSGLVAVRKVIDEYLKER